MEELELSPALEATIREYMEVKQMPFNTRRTYGYSLGKLFRKFPTLSRHNLPEVLKSMPHQNQRAVLTLINRYCFDNNIDFKVTIPRITRPKKKLTAKTLSLEEVDLMIRSAPKPYDLMLECIFKIGGGLRISEAIRLGWHHFRWPDWLKDRGVGIVKIIDSKGADRVINVPKSLMEKLYAHAELNHSMNEFGIPMQGFVFSFDESYGKPYKPKLKQYDLEKWKDLYIQHAYSYFVYHVLKKHCIPAVGRKINIHALRHTRATQLYDDKDIPIEIIQKLLGHKEIQTTMIYTQITNKKVIDAMKDID